VRDGFRVLDVKIERILSANSFVHGALPYAAPTLNGIPRHRECARILDADIRLQHIAIIDHTKPLDNMEGTSNNDNFFVELIAGASRRDFCS
jgi:hypothetical protein